MNSRTARGSRTSVETTSTSAHHVGRQVIEPAPGAKRGVQRHGTNPVAVGDEAFDEVRSDEAVTPGDGDDVRHGFSDSRARGRIPRRLDGTQYAIRPWLSFPSMTPGDSSAERPPVAQTLVFIVPRLARGGMLSVMQAAWAQLHDSRIVVVTQEHSTASVEHETVLLPRTFGDPLRFPGAWIYAWRVARAAAGIARAASRRGDPRAAGRAWQRRRRGPRRPSNADAGRGHGPRQRDRLSDAVLLARAPVEVATSMSASVSRSSERPCGSSTASPFAVPIASSCRADEAVDRFVADGVPRNADRSVPRPARPRSIPILPDPEAAGRRSQHARAGKTTCSSCHWAA